MKFSFINLALAIAGGLSLFSFMVVMFVGYPILLIHGFLFGVTFVVIYSGLSHKPKRKISNTYDSRTSN